MAGNIKRRTDVCCTIPRGLLDRVDEAAAREFVPRRKMVAALLGLGLQAPPARLGTALYSAEARAPITRRRDGGKVPAKILLRPVKAHSKRGRVLRYFLSTIGATVSGATTEFGLSRSGVFTHWTTLNRIHGIGYAFDSASDAIMARLPCDEAAVFGHPTRP